MTGKEYNRKQVSKLFKLNGKTSKNGGSTALIIPKHMALKHGLLDLPAWVTFEDTDDGLLIKKVKLP